MVAVDNNFSAETLKKLIDLGCDVNSQNTQDEMTCLHSAFELGYHDIFKLLLEHGANPNLKAEGESVIDLCQHNPSFKQILN